MTRMQAEQRAAAYNADKERTSGGRSYAAIQSVQYAAEWSVATYKSGFEVWREWD